MDAATETTPTREPPPSRANRVAAALVVLLLLASLARSLLRPPPTAPPVVPTNAATAPLSAPAPVPADTGGPTLRFEIQAEVAAKESGPPLELRLRTHDGATRPFDLTARAEATRTRFALSCALPVARPELPLRGELVGESWCIPPGLASFEVARLDQPVHLVVVRARRLDVEVRSDEGALLPAVRLVHESGRELATTGADGRARLIRPLRERREAVVALAAGFAPALVPSLADDDGRPLVDRGKPLLLRRVAAMGRLHGVVRAADGSAVAGALVVPRWFAGGAPPGDSTAAADLAARALWRLAEWTKDHPLPALAVQSGADGGFEMALPFPGRVVLTATQRELGKATATVELAAGAAAAGARTEVELRFPRQLVLIVTATLDGAPAPRCVVEILRADPVEPALLAAATGDASGHARLNVPDLPPLFVVVRSDGAAPSVQEFDPQGKAEAALAVTLERGRAVAFTLTGGDGLDPAAALVAARDAASHALLATVTTDAHGRGRFGHLPAGRALDLSLPAAAGDAPTIKSALLLQSATDGGGEVDLGALPMKRE